VGRWSTTLAYRTPLTGPFFVLVIVLLLLPQIIGGLAYFILYFRVPGVTQKYRVLLVSWSIIVWFLSPLIALAGGLAQQDWWQLVSRLIGLTAALTILMAYLPPRWLQDRYGITSLSNQSQEG
jgi:Kef-type K+ transport system membrane component KefB